VQDRSTSNPGCPQQASNNTYEHRWADPGRQLPALPPGAPAAANGPGTPAAGGHCPRPATRRILLGRARHRPAGASGAQPSPPGLRPRRQARLPRDPRPPPPRQISNPDSPGPAHHRRPAGTFLGRLGRRHRLPMARYDTAGRPPGPDGQNHPRPGTSGRSLRRDGRRGVDRHLVARLAPHGDLAALRHPGLHFGHFEVPSARVGPQTAGTSRDRGLSREVTQSRAQAPSHPADRPLRPRTPVPSITRPDRHREQGNVSQPLGRPCLDDGPCGTAAAWSPHRPRRTLSRLVARSRRRRAQSGWPGPRLTCSDQASRLRPTHLSPPGRRGSLRPPAPPDVVGSPWVAGGTRCVAVHRPAARRGPGVPEAVQQSKIPAAERAGLAPVVHALAVPRNERLADV